MKFSVLLLSFLLLITASLSYGDSFFMSLKQQCIPLANVEKSQVVTHDDMHKEIEAHDEHHEEEHKDSSDCEDGCHYCICACSPHTIVFQEVAQLHLPIQLQFFSNRQSYYESLLKDSYSGSIFQPPQRVFNL